MSQDEVLSAHEAMLLYTQTKVEMANRFREGISYEDFVEFEKRLEMVDRVLEREARKLAQKLKE